MKRALPIVLGIIMLAGAIGHVAVPDIYAPLVPPFMPELLANVLAAIGEAAVGILLLVPKWRNWGGLGFMALMLGFLPIHVWELFRDNPMIGPLPATIFRLVMQFVLIYAGWWIYRTYREA